MDKKEVALIKGSRGCPYQCSYCFCKNLNNKTYVPADFNSIFKEMKEIEGDNYWIVDDVLLTDRKSALQFIEASSQHKFTGKIIAYLRADFIVREKDLLKDLYEAGLKEVIVGFESPDHKELVSYNKKMDKGIYSQAIKLLRESKIELTALFMVNPNYGIREFKRLWTFIWKNRIDLYTISIFTPIEGSDDFHKYKEDLLTHDPSKFDFLHLVISSKLPKVIFYIVFYLSHLKLLFSKRIWKFILAR